MQIHEYYATIIGEIQKTDEKIGEKIHESIRIVRHENNVQSMIMDEKIQSIICKYLTQITSDKDRHRFREY